MDDFPDAVLSHVLGFLDTPRDLLRVQISSPHMRELAAHNTLWGPLLLRGFDILTDVSGC